MKFSFLLAITILFAMSSTLPIFAQEESLLVIDVSEETYDEGETIVVSGNVASVFPGTPVIIQIIYGEGSIIDVAQIIPAEDGSFTHTLLAQGPLWQNDGEYVARASYGTGNISEANFDFFTKQDTTQTEKNFEVEIPNSTSTFDVEYTIRGGTMKDMIVDEQIFALIAIIDSIEDGTLTIELPRSSIDAKTSGCEGTDDVYIVLIDGIEVPYQEIDSTDVNRVITIEFEEGDSDIEIIGTCVIPEFGSIAIIILAISIISIITLSRKSILRI